MEFIENSDHAGWLYKRGSLIKSWKRRFFVLKGTHLVYYDTAQVDAHTPPKGSLSVMTVEVATNMNNGLLIHGKGGRILRVYADSIDNVNLWFSVISNVANHTISMRPSEKSSFASTEFSEDFPSSGSGDDEDGRHSIVKSELVDPQLGIHHSGWLSKEGKVVKSWKRRYFTLSGKHLQYFESMVQGKTPKGSGYVTDVNFWNEHAFGLSIGFEEGRIMHVSADSQRDVNLWYAKLKAAIDDNLDPSRTSHFFRGYSECDGHVDKSFYSDHGNAIPNNVLYLRGMTSVSTSAPSSSSKCSDHSNDTTITSSTSSTLTNEDNPKPTFAAEHNGASAEHNGASAEENGASAEDNGVWI